MSIENAFLIGFGFLLGASIGLQIYLAYKIQKNKRETKQHPSKAVEERMSSKATFRFGLFHTIFYLYVIIWSLYNIWVGIFSVFLGIAIIIGGLILIRKPLQLFRENRPVHAEYSIALPLLPRLTNSVTPELIIEILNEQSIIDAIKNDLKKTMQIGYKEQWRLGLLTPGMDKYDLSYNLLSRKERLSKLVDSTTKINLIDQIPIKRAAILHSTSYFNIQLNNILIIHGTKEPMIRRYPGWSYGLSSQTGSYDYMNIRDIEINTDLPSARNRNRILSKFLQEDGFPLKDSYLDGDPLTTERGGTIVSDKGEIKIIYPNYFVQSRLIDDEGNLVYMGLDENFHHGSTWDGIPVAPSLSKKLYKCVAYNDYIPIVRYCSFPYASNFMLPILDTPMSDSSWADLFIDTRGKARLFIAKEKTLDEWYEMMERLRQLFFGELAKKGYQLLGLTKDEVHLHQYFSQKQAILEDYFLILDWSLG